MATEKPVCSLSVVAILTFLLQGLLVLLTRAQALGLVWSSLGRKIGSISFSFCRTERFCQTNGHIPWIWELGSVV